jgi:hypothetical protein
MTDDETNEPDGQGPGLIEFGPGKDNAVGLAKMYAWAHANAPLDPGTVVFLERQVLAAREFRVEALLRCAALAAPVDARAAGPPEGELAMSAERLAFGLALASYVEQIGRRAIAAGTGRATECAREALERIALVLSDRFFETDLRVLVQWYPELDVRVRAACLAVEADYVPLPRATRLACREVAREASRRALPPGTPGSRAAGGARTAAPVESSRPGRPRARSAPDARPADDEWPPQSSLREGRGPGRTEALAELEIPDWWMEAPARPFPEGTPGIPIVDLRWAATWLDRGSHAEVCRHDPVGGGDALVVGALGPSATPGDAARLRLVAFGPTRHLHAGMDVLAEGDVDAQSNRAFHLTASPRGDVYAVWHGKRGLALAVADRRRWRLLATRDEPVLAAWFVPLPEPVVVWLKPAQSAPPARVVADPWAARVSQPDRPFPWPFATFLFAGVDETAAAVFVRGGTQGLSVVRWPSAEGATVHPVPGLGFSAAEDRIAGASRGSDGRLFVAWEGRRGVPARGPGSGPPVCAAPDEFLAGAVVAGGRVECVGRLAEAERFSTRRTSESRCFAALAAGRNLCLVTRFTTRTYDSEYEHEDVSHHFHVALFDPSLRPVVGQRTPKLLLDLGRAVHDTVRLIPRADGSISMIVQASVS